MDVLHVATVIVACAIVAMMFAVVIGFLFAFMETYMMIACFIAEKVNKWLGRLLHMNPADFY